MAEETFKNISRKNITTLSGNTKENIQIGCLQRIADSLEALVQFEDNKWRVEALESKIAMLEKNNKILNRMLKKAGDK